MNLREIIILVQCHVYGKSPYFIHYPTLLIQEKKEDELYIFNQPMQFKVVLIPSDALINLLSIKPPTALKSLWSSPGSGQWELFSSSERNVSFPFLLLFASLLLANSLLK